MSLDYIMTRKCLTDYKIWQNVKMLTRIGKTWKWLAGLAKSIMITRIGKTWKWLQGLAKCKNDYPDWQNVKMITRIGKMLKWLPGLAKCCGIEAKNGWCGRWVCWGGVTGFTSSSFSFHWKVIHLIAFCQTL
jgi:hypothetical protein